MKAVKPQPSDRFIRQPEVLAMIPFSPATLWRKVTAGHFPAPVKLSSRVTAWRLSEVKKWMDEK